MAKLLTLPWPSYWPYFGQKMAKLLTLQHIYIYIYMAVTSIGGQKIGQNLKKCPVWEWKMAQKNRHKNVAVFAVFLVSSFSMSLSFSHCFSLFPVVSCYLGIPKQPTKWGYRHIYIYCLVTAVCFLSETRNRLQWSRKCRVYRERCDQLEAKPVHEHPLTMRLFTDIVGPTTSHHITFQNSLHLMQCNFCTSILVCEWITRWCGSGQCMPSYLLSAWHTKIMSHRSFWTSFWICNELLSSNIYFRTNHETISVQWYWFLKGGGKQAGTLTLTWKEVPRANPFWPLAANLFFLTPWVGNVWIKSTLATPPRQRMTKFSWRGGLKKWRFLLSRRVSCTGRSWNSKELATFFGPFGAFFFMKFLAFFRGVVSSRAWLRWSWVKGQSQDVISFIQLKEFCGDSWGLKVGGCPFLVQEQGDIQILG